jgi:hypothetical protein
MTTFDAETIRKWRKGTHHLPRQVGDVARDVLDELVRLQGVNVELLEVCEEILRALTSPTRELLYSTRRELEPCERILKAAIEKAKKT